ncbi:MAG: peptidoglycan DD-metalloendopeptidase family protein [Paludibacteraceae bacterium]
MHKVNKYFHFLLEKLNRLFKLVRKANKKFYFNPETLDYEEIQITFSIRLRQILLHTLSGILLGVAFFFLFVSVVKSPKEKELTVQLNRMEGQYQALQGQMKEFQGVLTDLQERDDNLYRVIFQADPIPYESRHTTSNNMEYYDELMKMTNSQIVVNTTEKLNELKKQMYVQSKSYDEIVKLAQNKENMLKSIPAIQPVANKDLKRVASGWGYRYDPIYHTRRFHEGMDFTAPVGTDIYATGNGTVIEAGWQQGYGNSVLLDHGFGYQTFYAHMSEVKVKVGQSVTRGEIIGLVGSTGKSTGPHLHYEVHYKGQIMNPQNYYFLDLTPEEYDRMIQVSQNAGQTFD